MDKQSVCTAAFASAASELEAYLTANSTTMIILLKAEATMDGQVLVKPELPAVTDAMAEVRQQYLSDRTQAVTELQLGMREFNLWSNQWAASVEDLKRAEQRVTQLHEQYSSHVNVSPEELESLKQDSQLAQQALTSITADVQNIATLLRSSVLEKDQLTEQVAIAESQADKIHQLNHKSALRSELQKYLRTNRAAFMEDSWSSLTNYASHLISFVTDGFIHGLNRSDAGDFFIVEGGQLAPVEELSGARKSIVGLCLRLSLAHLFYGTGGFTLLDEVTADCSENNAARVAGMLRGLQTQVIMVTHRDSDAVNANHSIFLT
jgi:DNA repair exonuclease SbcCD ATPase subunit